MKYVYIVLTILLIIVAGIGGEAQAQAPTDFTWQASYWNNRSLAGSPIVRRNEPAIDHDWGLGSPHPDIDDDHFSARWSTYVDFRPATYRFAATSDDGIRVWVDGDLIINEWYDHPVQTFTGDKALSAGRHRIVVEYYEAERGAIAQLWWAPAPPPDGQNWRGEYYDNISLRGEPEVVREDPAIGFNWTDVAPAEGVSRDKFSARWTQRINFAPGNYRFEMTVDDGGRLWVNGRRLIDAWRIQSPTTYVGEIYLPGGSTPVRMEHFDNLRGAVAQLTWSRAPERTRFWRAEYYDNTSFSGAPALVRNDAHINFNWGNSSPAPARLGVNHFAARWTRTLDLAPGIYRFTIRVDDGGRLWIDDRLLIDAWQTQSPTTYSREINHVSGRPITVRMEYFENTGGSVAQLSWSRIGQPAFQTSRPAGGLDQLVRRNQ